MAEFGLSTLDDLSANILESSRAAVLAEIARLPRGSWRYEMTIDGYDTPITLAATTTIAEDGVRVDFAGTSAASRFGINCPLAYATAYSVFGLSCALAPRVPNNAGSLSAYSVTAPAHTIVNALPPAPVASRHIVGQMLPDVVFGGLRQAIPDRVPAEGNLLPLSHDLPHPRRRGEAPLRRDSGGPGTQRGGHGLELEIENRSDGPIEILAAFDRTKFPPRGRTAGALASPVISASRLRASSSKARVCRKSPRASTSSSIRPVAAASAIHAAAMPPDRRRSQERPYLAELRPRQLWRRAENRQTSATIEKSSDAPVFSVGRHPSFRVRQSSRFLGVRRTDAFCRRRPSRVPYHKDDRLRWAAARESEILQSLNFRAFQHRVMGGSSAQTDIGAPRANSLLLGAGDSVMGRTAGDPRGTVLRFQARASCPGYPERRPAILSPAMD